MFAFNSVTVVMILVEVLRHGGALPLSTSDWFKSFCTDREKLPEVMILTHIYLLMGCAFPFTIAYI